MGDRESNMNRLLDNAEEYLIQAELKAKQAWNLARANLDEWRKDMARTDGYYLDKQEQSTDNSTSQGDQE